MYFNHISSLSELRTLYRRLAIANHPDKGGNMATMQAINAEYDKVFKAMQAGDTQEAKSSRYANEMPEEYRRIIEILIALDGIELELCGNWIWISGNTKQHKDELKASGCYWAAKKLMWYWRPAEYKCFGKHTKDMATIRNQYGSVKIDASGKEQQYTRSALA